MTPTIYRNWNYGLGDTWATIQLLAQKRGCEGSYLSTIQHGESLRPMQEEILSVLDRTYFREDIYLVDEEPNTDLGGYAVWAALPLPTHTRWCPYGRTICIQVDGVSTPELKNPPPQHVAAITAWAATNTYELVHVGKCLGLRESIKALARATFFVGCDSGMSHVAHSVGTPVYLLEYQLPVVTCHRHRAYVKCENVERFIAQAENYLTFRRFIDQQ
jgi:Glycosyltransferase family 9 (heptosyltransferase)